MQNLRMSLAALSLLSSACGRGEPAILIDQVWARETVAGQSQAAVYLRIANRGTRADRLVSVTSPNGLKATLHGASNDNGIHRMRELEGVDIPPSSAVELAPGGQHIMLSGLARPLRPYSRFPLLVRFARVGARPVEVSVRPAATAALGHDR